MSSKVFVAALGLVAVLCHALPPPPEDGAAPTVTAPPPALESDHVCQPIMSHFLPCESLCFSSVTEEIGSACGANNYDCACSKSSDLRTPLSRCLRVACTRKVSQGLCKLSSLCACVDSASKTPAAMTRNPLASQLPPCIASCYNSVGHERAQCPPNHRECLCRHKSIIGRHLSDCLLTGCPSQHHHRATTDFLSLCRRLSSDSCVAKTPCSREFSSISPCAHACFSSVVESAFLAGDRCSFMDLECQLRIGLYVPDLAMECIESACGGHESFLLQSRLYSSLINTCVPLHTGGIYTPCSSAYPTALPGKPGPLPIPTLVEQIPNTLGALPPKYPPAAVAVDALTLDSAHPTPTISIMQPPGGADRLAL